MANEIVRSKAAQRLADLLHANSAAGGTLAIAVRESGKIVVLTQAEYDALAVKEANTLYFTVG